MEAQSIGLFVAFAAGLLSFLSPCVLPLIPSYVTFITGMSLDELTAEEAERERARRAILVHGTLFVSGFTLVFVLGGATASFLGQLIFVVTPWLERVGGVLLLVFGLYLLGALRLPGAEREYRIHLGEKPVGYLGTVLVGVTFAAGWTPCLGPVLSGIFVLAATTESMVAGMGLLFVYSLGLAVPFLIAAFLLQHFLGGMQKIGPWLPWINRISGGLLIALGLLMVTGNFTALTALLARFTPDFLLDRM